MNNPLLAYIPVAIVFGITPGPDAMLAMRSSLASGTKAGVLVALGAATGSMAWGLLAAAGLASVLIRFPLAFDLIRVAGAIYLAILGIQTIRRTTNRKPEEPETASQNLNGRMGAFRTGLVADLLNPKMGAFYLAVLPQFIPKDGNVFAWSLLLMTIEFTIAVICLTAYAALAASTRRLLTRKRIAVWFERALGTVLIGMGARVAIG